MKYDPGRSLRKLLAREKTIVVPGVFSPSAALLAREAGFRCIYFSGAGFSNLLGLPDLGVTTLTEVRDAVEKINSIVELPIIVDVDTGFGEVVNVSRTILEMERAGAAAVQIEDQVMPKRCGHLAGKEVVTSDEMVKKIIAAREARKSDLVIVARTDATAVEGLSSAIERANLYLEAGADVIFPDALESSSDFAEFSKRVRGNLLANMTEFGRTPYLKVSEFSKMGYKLVIFPVTAFRMAMKAAKDTYSEIMRSGSQRRLLKRMMSREEFYALSNYYKFERLDRSTEAKAKRLLGRSSLRKT